MCNIHIHVHICATYLYMYMYAKLYYTWYVFKGSTCRVCRVMKL